LPIRHFGAVALTVALLIGGAAARADERPPSPEERRLIETTLRQEGFASWDKIALVDGKWSVADVRRPDGRKLALELSNVDFSILIQRPAD
jgi:hypothetical protein